MPLQTVLAGTLLLAAGSALANCPPRAVPDTISRLESQVVGPLSVEQWSDAAALLFELCASRIVEPAPDPAQNGSSVAPEPDSAEGLKMAPESTQIPSGTIPKGGPDSKGR